MLADVARPTRIEPGPGQESVWDYPRPPRLEPTTARLVVVHGGVVIADTTAGFRVLETSQLAPLGAAESAAIDVRWIAATNEDLLAEPVDEYDLAAPATVLTAQEPPVEERELLQGYRDASQEVREILLDIARKATHKRDFGRRSERND